MADERIKHSSEHPSGGFLVEVYDKTRLKAEMPILLPQLTEVTTSALGKTPEDMLKVASEWEEVIAIKEEGKIVGYGGYVVENIPGIGKILHESGKMVAKEAQGKRYGAQITAEALTLHPDADYLTFTSQNPREIQSVRKALNGKRLAPIDVGYSEEPGLKNVLRNIISYTDRKGINRNTGLRPEIYFGERFGDYVIDISNPDIGLIESRLELIGFNRDAGDGVFFIAKLKDVSPEMVLSERAKLIAQQIEKISKELGNLILFGHAEALMADEAYVTVGLGRDNHYIDFPLVASNGLVGDCTFMRVDELPKHYRSLGINTQNILAVELKNDAQLRQDTRRDGVSVEDVQVKDEPAIYLFDASGKFKKINSIFDSDEYKAVPLDMTEEDFNTVQQALNKVAGLLRKYR